MAEGNITCRICLSTAMERLDLNWKINKNQEILQLAARYPNDQFACAETYSDCFLLCTNINLLNDKKHVNICKLCGDKILSAFNMICRARLSELLLQELHLELEDMESNLLNEKEFDKRNKCITSKTDNSKYMCPNCYNNYSSKSLLDDHYSYRICKKSALYNKLMDMENLCVPIESIEQNFKERLEEVDPTAFSVSEDIREFSVRIEANDETDFNISVEETQKTVSIEELTEYSVQADITESVVNEFLEEMTGHASESTDYVERKTPADNIRKSLRSSDQLSTHQSNEIFACDECDKIFHARYSLALHKRKHTAARNFPYICEICGKKFAVQNYLRMHLWNHQGLKYQCEDCDKQFYSLRGLKEHRPTHTGIMPFPCCHCQKAYPSKTKYKHHLTTVHRIKPTSEEMLRSRKKSKLSQKLQQSSYRVEKGNEKKNNYVDGDMSMGTQETTENISVVRDLEECDLKTKKLNDNPLSEQKVKMQKTKVDKTKSNEKERETFECNECDKVYFTKYSLILHKRKHTGELIPCEKCGKGFVNKDELSVHMRFHNRDYPFVCEICGKKFAVIGHLRTHVWKHQGLKYQCEDCDKQFLSLKGLNDHRPTHTGIMPFPCSYCERGYPSLSKYKTHLATVHKIKPTAEELLRSRKASKLPKKTLRRSFILTKDASLEKTKK